MPYLHAFGAHLPERVVTNAEIAVRVGKTPEWMESASGIRERRWAASATSVTDLAESAAVDCLAKAGTTASKLGMIIVASGSSAASGFPGPAATVAARLGLEGTPALDVPMASAGSLFGLAMAARFASTCGDVLVIGAEKMSSIVELSADEHGMLDPNTAILFGDGAGAALVSETPGPWEILDSVLHTDGQFREDLAFDGRSPLRMNGLSVILQASRKMPAAIQEVLAKQSIAAGDVTALLLHQANQNLLVRVGKAVGIAPERVYSNVGRYGNTSSASMLIAAAEWAAEQARPGPIVFSAFGAGFHWGALVARSV
ncbi:MAG: 3-oxoacyl-[acyl-carrier-protein] synthase III C-terminal domain-containing protein [Bryobacteraceae bacterium]